MTKRAAEPLPSSPVRGEVSQDAHNGQTTILEPRWVPMEDKTTKAVLAALARVDAEETGVSSGLVVAWSQVLECDDDLCVSTPTNKKKTTKKASKSSKREARLLQREEMRRTRRLADRVAREEAKGLKGARWRNRYDRAYAEALVDILAGGQ